MRRYKALFYYRDADNQLRELRNESAQPCSRAQFTAGCRRYANAQGMRLVSVDPIPAPAAPTAVLQPADFGKGIRLTTPDVDNRPIGQRTRPADLEAELRAGWTVRGIPIARQDAIIAQVTAQARPSAHVGPFTIGQPALDTLPTDPEHQAREESDCTAPRAEVCDTWSEPAALRRSFGTRPGKPLRPAKQDDLFNPITQGRLF